MVKLVDLVNFKNKTAQKFEFYSTYHYFSSEHSEGPNFIICMTSLNY
jgi:hypothetical protein